MKNTFHDLDPDVREIARQFADADFSPQSQQQESLRAHLIEQIGSQQSPRTPLHTQSRGRLYAVIGMLAASLILGMIILMQTSAVPVASISEEIIPITPVANPTGLPVEALPRFYDSLAYASAAVSRPLFAPTWLPQGYVFSFSGLSSPARSLTTLTSLYIKERPWRTNLLNGFPPLRFTGDADYLYIAQEIENPGSVSPIWNLPPEMSMTEAELPDAINSRAASTDNSYGSFSKDQYKIVLWRTNGEFFLLISRLLDYPDLLKIAESLEPLPVPNIFISPPDQPGTCTVSGPGNAPFTPWVLPLKKESYTFQRGVYTGHTGVDLLAPKDTPLFAANSGKVVFAGWSEWGYGNTIIISHGEVLSMYAHLNAINVTCNELVQAGQQIGTVGSSGNSSGPHLHFEMRRANDGGSLIDPAQILDFQAQ